MVTETDEIAAALDRAAERWPKDAGSRKRLLLHLVEAGDQAAEAESQALIAQRRATLERMRTEFTEPYDPDYLKRLREDWPD
jgi:hypothetical protein